MLERYQPVRFRYRERSGYGGGPRGGIAVDFCLMGDNLWDQRQEALDRIGCEVAEHAFGRTMLVLSAIVPNGRMASGIRDIQWLTTP
ncbi:hypothetical protein RLDS_12155 [Sphingobium lactosutens DS20]|uniref:Uncharacterized protein n=1 Tax=Sphingobium lactosutens DS20 TaxID=1331060 RepID=T0HEZ9_9SPHN|nr:hypothetical protein RLDS_12155 [Sphingobium lactosutens DS20]